MELSWTKNKILFIEPNPVEPKINYFWMNGAQLGFFLKNSVGWKLLQIPNFSKFK